MCFGGTKQPAVAVRQDPTIKFVEGNIKDPKDEEGMGFENPEPSDINVGGDMPKKKVKDEYNQGGVEGSNSGLNIA